MNVHYPSNSSPAPARIVVAPWRRFSDGLWRVTQGDIAVAYSAGGFPKVKVFTHERRWFTNGSYHYSRAFETTVDGYPLPSADEYRGPESVPYSYEGREVTYKGKSFRLGAKVLFVASEPTIEECRQLLRVMFADGGYFASGCEYPKFLTGQCPCRHGQGIG